MDVPAPKLTSINGKKCLWPAEVWVAWNTRLVKVMKNEKRPVSSANFFTPRPYQDEYERGSETEGFVYVVGCDVGLVEWIPIGGKR